MRLAASGIWVGENQVPRLIRAHELLAPLRDHPFGAWTHSGCGSGSRDRTPLGLVGRAWRIGGRLTGIVRSPYVPGQQHPIVVHVAVESHQPDVDAAVRQVGHHSVGARVEAETDQDPPDLPDGFSALASVPFLVMPRRSTKPVSTGSP